MKKESIKMQLLDIFYSRFQNNMNFINIDHDELLFANKYLFFDIDDFTDYRDKMKTLKNNFKSYNDICFCKIIFLELEMSIDFQILHNIFSFLKENKYDFSGFFWKYQGKDYSKRMKANEFRKILMVLFESIFNSKYQPNRANYLQNIIQRHHTYTKKLKRYLKIHGVKLVDHLGNMSINLNNIPRRENTSIHWI